MKKLIQLTALFLVLSTGLFAATAKGKDDEKATSNTVTIQGKTNFGIEVKLNKNAAAKTLVLINDSDDNVLYKGKITSVAGNRKVFRIGALEDGNYTITALTGLEIVKKQIHVYVEDGKKTYLMMQ